MILSMKTRYEMVDCEFCKDELSCRIRDTFMEIRDNTNEILRRTTLNSLNNA